MSLARARVSEWLQVVGVRDNGVAGLRLMEMGLVVGALVQVLGRAPLGDPLRVRLGDSDLSLRSSDAEFIDVTPAASAIGPAARAVDPAARVVAPAAIAKPAA